jgi:hypothetical protein
MSPRPGGPGDSPIAAVARAHPGWECWAGVSGMVYARLLKSSPPVIVTAEDVPGLHEVITQAETALDGLDQPGRAASNGKEAT